GGDATLGGLLRLRLRGRLDHPTRCLDRGAASCGVELERQARLAPRGGVRMNRADLRGAVERGMRLRERLSGGLGIRVACRDAQGGSDQRLRGAPPWLKDVAPAL